jgi:hypothetical protein
LIGVLTKRVICEHLTNDGRDFEAVACTPAIIDPVTIKTKT